MFLDGIIKFLRAPLDLIRSKVFGVSSMKGGALGDVRRIGQVGSEYKAALGGAAGKAKAVQGKAADAQKAGAAAAGKAPKKKMGLFSKKKKCPSCGQKLHMSWDQCPYCGAAAGEPAAAAPPPAAAPMSAPMPSSGQKMKTMAIDIGGGRAQVVSGEAGTGWLVPLEGPQTGELFQLRAGRCTVGTAGDCDIVLKDPSISGRHAEFSSSGRNFRVTDLGSTNGTFVNDKRVQSEELVDNDQIKLGRTNFKFKAMN